MNTHTNQTPSTIAAGGESILPEPVHAAAVDVVAAAQRAGIRIATAETVTGGLLATALTEVPGVSAVYERGFVLYHTDAKSTGLGVPAALTARYGAVSAEVTAALADGLRRHITTSDTAAAVAGAAITGYAGPTGGNNHDPVGTVYVATFFRSGPITTRREVFPGTRLEVKVAAVHTALSVLHKHITGRALQ
ncbi:nicotinamide-nucleotide amidohydrolase family protein [Rhodococcus sp. IEGM 1241]|uniref:CinA family protein n=1 Tax=Rhodococcus sp. IEGM 1241 TaxID=3082228 RepID=UPI00295579C6|nr:nicotinamide-nucleotide amidohydrolase family protein [Rhodococcus sp. IEGM 1241]MDV8015941.1 nicotinamide-nucleotide amidohydrolase family protein [Rhodococcus sp. IEGM 1241]